MDIKKISKFLKNEREESNFTQQDVAEKLGVSKAIISKWECGKAYPSLEYLPKLSELYGVSINEILAGSRLSLSDKETFADENLLEHLQKNKVNRIINQIIFIVSLCTIMILLEIVCYMAGVKNVYYNMIFIIILLYGLIVEFCIYKLK
mgnify:CR=1 FL=1